MSDALALDMVNNLVTQFSSALDFYRELVQNSIDAGTDRVDVWTEFITGEAEEGTIAIHVDDYGEGMDENIIDNQLTRLFASTKEDDLTKIGKFGIGFVSVFALLPKAVLVHTGRGGEYWEVCFHEDRSFTKTQIDNPVEGTQITLFLAGTYARYAQLVEDSLKTLRRWCAHSETEVTFEDRSAELSGRRVEMIEINEPFEVEGIGMRSMSFPGTEIVAAYTREPVYGFYNRGLTLALTRIGDDVLGHRAPRFRTIAFKIKSRYLEHTLSRETVLKDENFERAMELLEKAVAGPLLDGLLQDLEALAALDAWTISEIEQYAEMIDFLSREPLSVLATLGPRRVLRSVDGEIISLQKARDAWRRDGRVLVASAPSELTESLRSQKVPVVLGATDRGWRRASWEAEEGRSLSSLHRLLARFLAARTQKRWWQRRGITAADVQRAAASVVEPDDVFTPVRVDDEPPDESAALLKDAQRLLKNANAGYRRLSTCVLTVPMVDAPAFVVGRRSGAVMARPPELISETRRRWRPEAAVNRDHPQYRAMVDLYRVEPEVAAYCLAKTLLLTEDRLLERDVRIADEATRRQQRRL